jgi:hypothetical protein
MNRTKQAKRSKCHFCGQPMTEKPVIKATDAERFINEYCTEDEELVWVAKDGNAICYADGIAHCTTKDWYACQ